MTTRLRLAILPALAVISLVPVALAAIPPEAGRFVFRKYAPKEYSASPQNWAVVEDARGVMFFGNTEGLLEFDGVLWRRHQIPGGGLVRSLALDDSGTVFAGGQNEAGYLAPGPDGKTTFVSIVQRLDPAERKFGDVWSILATPAGVYFSTTERLILLEKSGSLQTWKTKGRFRRTVLLDGVVHVQVTGLGLHQLAGRGLSLAPGGEKFAKLDVRGAFRSARGLVIATSKGFFLKTSTGFEELIFDASRPAGESLLYSVAQLRDNLIAFGTARGGLIFADGAGRVLRIYNKDSGLPSDYITAITPDSQGGVWLATGSGIARFTPRFTEFSEASGVRGTLYGLARWRDSLYAGTASGLFRLKPGLAPNESAFEPIPGIKEPVWSLLPGPARLFIGTQRGLYQLAGDTPQLISATEVVYDISPSRKNSGTLLLASRAGALILKQEGNAWVKEAEIPSQGEEFRTIAEDEQGIIWATTRTAIVRADLRSGVPAVRTFTTAQGLPPGWKNVFRARNRLFFATESGLVKPDASGERFVPDTSLGSSFADGSKGILLMREDLDGNLWISGAGYHGLLRAPGTPSAQWQPMPLVAAGLDELWTLQSAPDGVLWAAGPDSRLVRYDSAFAPSPNKPFGLLVRRLLDSDSRNSLFDGSAPLAAPIRIPYSQNSLRAEFVAPFYDLPERVEYQALMGGAVRAAPWSREPWKDLSNLWEGSYQLRIRARNPYGERSKEVVLPFVVAAPWFRAWYAYTFYILSFGTALWLMIRWRIRSLKESNLRLEHIVEERTAEIRRQRDQIFEQERKSEALLLNILPASVAEELRSNGSVQPMHFEDVTVCFTDFVGFTLSSETLAAEDLVAKLHEYFSAFDDIVARYGLEKLKTIGDSYMFASGLPVPNQDHAVNAALAALEIVAKAREIGARQAGVNWQIRVGLNSGPVVAGVVGLKKFAFDIWGDTVNLASRMESSGVPNRVNISAATYRRVRDVIECEPRGLVHTKDGRDLEMYLVKGAIPRL